MNKSLSVSVYNAIKSALSASTEHVYFDHLPSEKLLSELTATYELNNSFNLLTFEDQEAGKTYFLEVKVNDMTSDLFENYSVFIKRQIYRLTQTNSRVKHISLNNEETFFDDELKIWTMYLRFEIQYT